MTPEDFQRLYELQIVDRGIAQRQQIIREIDDGSAAGAQLAEDERQLEELEEQLRQKQSRQRKLELDLEGVEAEKKEKMDRAYGGTVSDPKELSALERKIDELERNMHRHEDMVLELLEEIDELEQNVAAQRQRTDGQRAKHQKIVRTFEETTAQAREEIEKLQAEREELASELPPQLLSPYENLRAREDGIAVSALRGGTCAECNVAVPRARWPMIERGATIVKCENCRRILVKPER
ncbi:MAG: zinc ribbon domain-containing protein [Armatimonadota bacterium]|jgi:predicted  nucleic acid-binding Zn-ribbon protein